MRTFLFPLAFLISLNTFAQGTSCLAKTDYDPLITCSDQIEVVHNLSELSDYQIDYGASSGNYKHLKIDFNPSDYLIEVHSPCSITVSKEVKFNAITDLCLDAQEGLILGKEGKVTAQKATLISQKSSLTLEKSYKVTAQALHITALNGIALQKEANFSITGPILISSTGDSNTSNIIIEQESKLNSASIELTSNREIQVQKSVKLTTQGQLKLTSSGSLSSNNIIIQKEAKLDAQSFSMKAYALVSLGQDSKLTITNNAEMISTGSESFSQALVDKSAKVSATNFKLNSGKKAELGKESLVTISSVFEMDAPECLIRQDAVYTAAQKVGRCIGSAIPNQLPIALAGDHQAVSLNQVVSLDGSNSYDLDGDKLSYTWSIVSKPASSTAILSSPNTPFPSLAIDQVGDYVLNLIVSDGKGNSLPSAITLSTSNVAPIAVAPRDQSITSGTQIALDGSNSYDPNNDPLTYSWTIIQKPSTSTAQIIDANQSIAQITPDVAGDYILSLTVNDGTLNSLQKTFVFSTNNTRPVAEVVGADNAHKNQSVVLDGASSFDDQNSPLTYKWALLYSPSGSTPVLSGLNASSLQFSSAKSGKYVLSLIVNDGSLNSIATNHVVNVQNQLPNALITSSSAPVVLSGSTINLSAATSNDPDNDPLTYTWTIVAKPASSNAILTSTNAQTTNLVTDISGDYTLKLTLSDGEGTTESQATFKANLQPLAQIAMPTGLVLGKTVLLDGSSSNDPDGDPLTYSWSLTSKPTSSNTNIGEKQFKQSSLLIDVEGDYTVSLTVNDPYFSSVPVLLNFSVIKPINHAPILNPVSNMTITLGDEVKFTITATDSDNDFINYTLTSNSILSAGMNLEGATGVFSWRPSLSQTGNFLLNFIASDGKQNSNVQTMSITVNPVPVGLPTIFKGRVMDSNATVGDGVELPIVGATISIVDTDIVTTTNIFGEFELVGIPDLETPLFKIDSSTAIAPPTGGRYANFIELIHLIRGTTNVQQRPFYLPRVAATSITPVEPNKPTTVFNDEINVEVNVPANAAMNPDGTPFNGELSVSLVPANLAPVSMPPNFDPGMLITVQPSGVRFDQDVPITYPNFDNLPAGAEIDIMQMNDKLGVFEVIGVGKVSSDGKRVETVSGGLRNTSWGALVPRILDVDPSLSDNNNSSRPPSSPPSPPNSQTKRKSITQKTIDNTDSGALQCGELTGSSIDPYTGRLIDDHYIVGHKSMGETRVLSLIYNSVEATGNLIQEVRQPLATRPLMFEVRPIIDGIEQNTVMGFDLQDVNLNSTNALFPMVIKTGGLTSGFHKYDARVNAKFALTTVGKYLSDSFENLYIVLNRLNNSPFGYGRTLTELQRVYVAPNGDIAWFHNGADYFIFKKQANGAYVAPNGVFVNAEIVSGRVRLTSKDMTVMRFDSEGRILSIVDRNKNETSFAYDSFFDRPTHIQDPSGKRFLFNYDTNNLISTITDAGGRTWSFEFDAERNLTKMIYPNLTFESFSYLDNHKLISKKNVKNGITQYQMNDYAQVQAVTYPDGTKAALRAYLDFTYDLIPAKNLKKLYRDQKSIQNLELVTTRTRSESSVSCVERKVGEDETTVYYERVCTRYNVKKQVVEVLTPVNLQKIKNYDSNGNLIISIDETNRGSRYFYDQKGNLEKFTNFLDLRALTQMSYDPVFNQLTSINDMNGNKTAISLDTRGNAQTILDPQGNRTDLKYNSRGQVTFITDHNRQTTQLVYSEVDGNLVKVIDPLGNITQMSYDNLGNVSTISDPKSKTTQFFYNEMNLVTKTIGADLKETNFEYDPKGNLTKVTDSRNGVSTFSYDSRDRVTSRIDPLGNSELFSYDTLGNLISKTDRLGRVTYFEYDLDSRLVKKLLPDNTLIEFSYDAAGRVLSITNGLNSVEYTYDVAGRVKTTKAIGDNTPTVTLTNTFDNAGNRTRLAGFGGFIDSEFDSLNRIKKLTNSNSLIYEILYDKLGRRAELVLPNGTKTQYGYDKNSQLTSLTHSDQVKSLYVFGYKLDASGNRTQMTTQRDGLTNLNSTLTYGYDDIYQVVSATNPIIGNQVESFVYDDLGNRLTRDGETFNAIYDLNNRLVENQNYQYSYDLAGSLVSKVNKNSGEIQNYSWDSEGQLIQIEWKASVISPVNKTVNYTYDVLGRRIEKNIDGAITRYVYDNEDIIAEYDGNNNLITTFTHGSEIDEPLSMQNGSSKYFYHADGLNSIIGLTNESGSIVQHYVYGSFGNLLAIYDANGTDVTNAPPIANPYGFTGRELDLENYSVSERCGLMYYRSRYYDSCTGKYISEDPAGLDGEDTNFYRMVNNNPINYYDPDGLTGLPARARVGGGGSFFFAGDFGGGGGAAIAIGIGLILKPILPNPGKEDQLTLSKGRGLGPVNDPELQGTVDDLVQKLRELRSRRRSKEENKLVKKLEKRIKELGGRNKDKERGGPCR